MPVLKTSAVPGSEEFARNQACYERLMGDFKKYLIQARAGGPADAVTLHKQRGKLTVRERIAALPGWN